MGSNLRRVRHSTTSGDRLNRRIQEYDPMAGRESPASERDARRGTQGRRTVHPNSGVSIQRSPSRKSAASSCADALPRRERPGDLRWTTSRLGDGSRHDIERSPETSLGCEQSRTYARFLRMYPAPVERWEGEKRRSRETTPLVVSRFDPEIIAIRPSAAVTAHADGSLTARSLRTQRASTARVQQLTATRGGTRHV